MLRFFTVLLSLLFLGIGCTPNSTNVPATPDPAIVREANRETKEPKPDEPQPQIAGPEQGPPPLPRANDDPQRARDYWEIHSLRGSRIGIAHFEVSPLTENGSEFLFTSSTAESIIQRLGQTVKQQIVLKSWDTPTGKLLRFEAEVSSGRETNRTTGTVSEDGTKLHLNLVAGNQKQSATLPWKPDWAGFFGVEHSLRLQPLAVGEKRSVVCLLPILNQPGETQLEAIGEEEVALPEGKRTLRKIATVTRIPAGAPNAQELAATIWTDERGEPLKSYITGIGQETVRATREQALAKNDPKEPRIDLIEESVVPIRPELKDALQTKRVVYRAHLKEGKIAKLFAECLSQRVTLIDEQTAEIEVRAIDSHTSVEKELPSPAPADSTPNQLIQSDDPRVGRLAMIPRRGNDDPWILARELEQLVHRGITKKNFSQAFASAAEVARTMEGDCTEHAVLLAAVCRARKIPTRCAVGLVYYPPKQGFAYHMWNEVWTGDRWLPLDATLGRGGVAADRLKLIDTNLDGANAYSAMLPVVQVFGRLELEVKEKE